jgi:hypothetical protein
MHLFIRMERTITYAFERPFRLVSHGACASASLPILRYGVSSQLEWV